MTLQLETDSTHVPPFQFLLFSELADFEFHDELLVHRVEFAAGILEDVYDFVVSVVQVQHLLH